MRCLWTLAWFFILQVHTFAKPAWEPIDEEMDILALIDDEPEGISFIQKDARLAAGCGVECPEDRSWSVSVKMSTLSAKEASHQARESQTSRYVVASTRGSTSRWLLMRTCGVQRIHIVVALGYVASPVAEFLTFVTATEWGLRGGESVPRYAQRLLGTQIDPPILNMVLFGFNALAFAISAPLWAALSRYLEPRKVMALCLMLQVPLLITLWPFYPKVEMALFLIFVHGMVTSASFLFLVFNFMMSIKAAR
eukprot:g25468.t1